MPWAIAAIYWGYMATPADLEMWHLKYKGEEWYTQGMTPGFAVPAGDLGFSVSVFVACAIVCLGMIILRRKTVGCELGGPPASKYGFAAFFVLLWFVYIAFSASASYGAIPTSVTHFISNAMAYYYP